VISDKVPGLGDEEVAGSLIKAGEKTAIERWALNLSWRRLQHLSWRQQYLSLRQHPNMFL